MKFEDQIRFKMAFKIGEEIYVEVCKALLKNEPDELPIFLNSNEKLKFAYQIMEKYNIQVDEDDIRVQFVGKQMLKYRNTTQLVYSICENLHSSESKIKMLVMTLNELLDNPDLDEITLNVNYDKTDIDKIVYETIILLNEAYIKLKVLMIAIVEGERFNFVQASMEFDDIVDELCAIQKILLQRETNNEQYLEMLDKSTQEAELGEFYGEEAE